jgi:acetyl-CoA acetyltransferase
VTDVAVVAFAESAGTTDSTTSGVEMLVPAIAEALGSVAVQSGGLDRRDIGFWCSGSSDYLAGRAFSFVQAVDALGAVPPIAESHVEMDGAWALYEAWVKILTGAAETALVYGFGKGTAGDMRRVLALQLDPYLAAPLWPDAISVAALQARLGVEAGQWNEKEMAEVAARSFAVSGAGQPAGGSRTADDLLAEPYVADPLRAHDCAPFTDGASVVILAAGERAGELCERPAWITGFAHRTDSGSLGARDLTVTPSATAAAEAAGALSGAVDVAELHAPFTHQELLLRTALDLPPGTRVTPSGGVLGGNPMFAAGLARIGWAARAVMSREAGRAIGHATSGPCLQQNLVCVMEAAP